MSTVPDKGMNTYAMESFKVFIFNKFAKIALKLWCIECKMVWEKNI